MTKFDQEEFHSIVRIQKVVKSGIIVTNCCLRRFCHGVILKMTKVSTLCDHHVRRSQLDIRPYGSDNGASVTPVIRSVTPGRLLDEDLLQSGVDAGV